jgi:hypothetical protein
MIDSDWLSKSDSFDLQVQDWEKLAPLYFFRAQSNSRVDLDLEIEESGNIKIPFVTSMGIEKIQ